MPYRRLPNTDTARIRAIKNAIDKGKELPPHKLAFTSKTLVRLQRILPMFENNIIVYRQSLLSQSKKSKDYNEISKKARIYLTHFIKVMNRQSSGENSRLRQGRSMVWPQTMPLFLRYIPKMSC